MKGGPAALISTATGAIATAAMSASSVLSTYGFYLRMNSRDYLMTHAAAGVLCPSANDLSFCT